MWWSLAKTSAQRNHKQTAMVVHLVRVAVLVESLCPDLEWLRCVISTAMHMCGNSFCIQWRSQHVLECHNANAKQNCRGEPIDIQEPADCCPRGYNFHLGFTYCLAPVLVFFFATSASPKRGRMRELWPLIFEPSFWGRGCDEALFSEEKGFQ